MKFLEILLLVQSFALLSLVGFWLHVVASLRLLNFRVAETVAVGLQLMSSLEVLYIHLQ